LLGVVAVSFCRQATLIAATAVHRSMPLPAGHMHRRTTPSRALLRVSQEQAV
jgi:hypothetical protein